MPRRSFRRALTCLAVAALALSVSVADGVVSTPAALAQAPAGTGPLDVVLPGAAGSADGAQVLDLGDDRIGVWSWSSTGSQLARLRLRPGSGLTLDTVGPSPLPVPTRAEPIVADGSRVAYESAGRIVVYDVLNPSTPVWSVDRMTCDCGLTDMWWPFVLTDPGNGPDRVIDARTGQTWSGPETPGMLVQNGFTTSADTTVTFDVASSSSFAAPVRGRLDLPSCPVGQYNTIVVPAAHGIAYTCADQNDWHWHTDGTPASAAVRLRPPAGLSGYLVNTKTPLGALTWVIKPNPYATSCAVLVMDQGSGASHWAAYLPCASLTFGGTSATRTSPVMTVIENDGLVHVLVPHQGLTADFQVAYLAAGGTRGPLGRPLAARRVTPGPGETQDFQGGRIHWSASTGAHPVVAPISAAYDRLTGESGPLGYPVGARRSTAGGGWTQDFQRGRIHWSAATGAHAVFPPISAAYDPLRGESGVLGYPVGARRWTVGVGWTQDFQHGRIHWSEFTGAHAVIAPISAAYDRLMGESGPLGYPVGGRRATAGGGWTQDFEFGRIHWSGATGAHAVMAPISAPYDRLQGESGPLGYPLGGRRSTAGGGWTQDFQHGRIHGSPATGTHAVFGEIGRAYDRMWGESGVLGYPVAGRRATAGGGWTQDFQRGRIHWSAGTGAHAVSGPIGAAYDAVGGESGRLGYPRAGETYVDGTRRQLFQRGEIVHSPSTGTRVIG